uniref:hypothetical protein n=1 Tax=Ningiella ruwaisensis TaxID=2364274 RepID=UPI00109F2160|nr:hypothetical protein [Ningiella ruwaisensis]
MIIIVLIASFIVSLVYMHTESVVYAMSKRKWTLAALFFGPLILPMFQISKRMAIRRASGFQNLYFSA